MSGVDGFDGQNGYTTYVVLGSQENLRGDTEAAHLARKHKNDVRGDSGLDHLDVLNSGFVRGEDVDSLAVMPKEDVRDLMERELKHGSEQSCPEIGEVVSLMVLVFLTARIITRVISAGKSFLLKDEP